MTLTGGLENEFFNHEEWQVVLSKFRWDTNLAIKLISDLRQTWDEIIIKNGERCEREAY